MLKININSEDKERKKQTSKIQYFEELITWKSWTGVEISQRIHMYSILYQFMHDVRTKSIQGKKKLSETKN